MKFKAANRGFSLITALFVLLAFASIAAAMVSIMGTQTQSVNLALLESRVYAAAAMGIDYGNYRAVNDCFCGRNNATIEENISAPSLDSLGISVTVQCTSTPHSEDIDYHVYNLVSSAVHGTFGSPDYVYRRIIDTGTDTESPTAGCQGF